jgi:hypothetical protein
VRRIIFASHFGRITRLPFFSYNITQWFANDFCISHSSHLQVWIRDIDLVLSPILAHFARSAPARDFTCTGDTAVTFIGGGGYFTMAVSGWV